MKTKFRSIAMIGTALALLTGCTSHPLAGKTFSTEFENEVNMIRFLDNGKCVSACQYADQLNTNPYIWECHQLDTASYYIRKGQVFLLKNGKNFGRAPLKDSQLDFHFFGSGKQFDRSYKEEKRLKEARKSNRYAGTIYVCYTMTNTDTELLFIDDETVIFHEVDKANLEIAPYEITSDKHVIIKTKTRVELTPDHDNLKVELMGTTYTFHKTNRKASELDGIEFTMAMNEYRQ